MIVVNRMKASTLIITDGQHLHMPLKMAEVSLLAGSTDEADSAHPIIVTARPVDMHVIQHIR